MGLILEEKLKSLKNIWGSFCKFSWDSCLSYVILIKKERCNTNAQACPYSELFWTVFSRIRIECGRIQSEYGKIRTRITPNRDTFYAMTITKVLTNIRPIFFSYWKQPIDSHCKSINWFLYEKTLAWYGLMSFSLSKELFIWETGMDKKRGILCRFFSTGMG